MKIEVLCQKGDATKIKGDLLESLSKDLLKAQGYSVIEEIRFTGVELDLLCKHKVNQKEIYVECKAQKEKIGAPVLRQLLGTVAGYDYSEGWLVSTSEFGKEAKGFVEMWKKKPIEQSSQLSFYTPTLILESLLSASVICEVPQSKALSFIGDSELLGDWTLIITPLGRFWSVYTLDGGNPFGVLFYNAVNGNHIQDKKILDNIALLDSTLTTYDLSVGYGNKTVSKSPVVVNIPSVVEVQIGDSWNDYRPSRPQDFVGRSDTQKEILSFLDSANKKTSDTRIFAITGNSGLGKSSLIAKVRDRARNKFYKNKYFVYAVDIRGAKTPSYISASLTECFKRAQIAGFGDKIDIQLTDPSTPLSSTSIERYLASVEKKGQVICLIFDQFEELYSKPDLFGVFEAAKDLMLEVSSYKGNFVLGFAWKTDSTTQQDHPAYHMWHELADYRKVHKLEVFDNGEIAKALTTFEKEVDYKIPIEIRHQIAHSSQGFPWLLKKLCINLNENIKKGIGAESIQIDLDVSSLFDNDLQLLTQPEHTCLKLIAQKAPADWSEIIELSGVAVLNSLVHKRLVIKSGDRLNIYWDIFKDYLMTGNVPIIPFNYIPTTEFISLSKVFHVLNKAKYVTSEYIGEVTSLNEKTVWNIGADLVMFGLAERKNTSFKCHRDLDASNQESMSQNVREKFAKHAFKLAVYKKHAGKTIEQNTIYEVLKSCLPKAKYSDKTWKVYGNRLTNFLVYSGYFVRAGHQIVVQDLGVSVIDTNSSGRQGKKRGVVFSANASPASVCEVLELIRTTNKVAEINSLGYRNSLAVVKRFELVKVNKNEITLNMQSINKYGGVNEAVWTSAKNEPVIASCIDYMKHKTGLSVMDVGKFVSSEYNLNWNEGSIKRNGGGLRQWSHWIKEGMDNSIIPTPRGRSK
jgi:hypothetical protein